MKKSEGSARPPGVREWSRIDRQAWEAIRCWPAHVDFDPIAQGLDFGDLTCWFLWEKVGRAVRHDIDPDTFAREEEMLRWPRGSCRVQSGACQKHLWNRFAGRLKNRFYRHGKPSCQTPSVPGYRNAKHNQPILFLPVPTARLLKTARSALEENYFSIVALEGDYEIPGITRIPYPKNLPEPDRVFGDRLHHAILKGLGNQGIALLRPDSEQLHEQIGKQLIQLTAAQAYFDQVKPDILLLHADNHPTHQHYALIAQKLGLPSIMLQHGLDCERYYLDDAYASAIAVWGHDRRERYQRDSQHQPDHLEITGNPEYDHLQLPETLNRPGDDWLWATRPHSSGKCYSPSRSPLEGLEILRSIGRILQKTPGRNLIIKPHPYDDVGLYRDYIRQTSAHDRISIVEDASCWSLFRQAGIVLSEDSTVGMEAMFMGIPVIHVHFAPTPPTMRFTEYGAAFAAFSPASLEDALKEAESVSVSDQAELIQCQRNCLIEYAGPCDGHAAHRVHDFMVRCSEGNPNG